MLKQEEEGKAAVCMRCHSLRHHGVVTPLKVPYEELKNHLRLIGEQSCLVVKIVDIFDFSGSFINNLREIVGNNPVILVGNKARNARMRMKAIGKMLKLSITCHRSTCSLWGRRTSGFKYG